MGVSDQWRESANLSTEKNRADKRWGSCTVHMLKMRCPLILDFFIIMRSCCQRHCTLGDIVVCTVVLATSDSCPLRSNTKHTPRAISFPYCRARCSASQLAEPDFPYRRAKNGRFRPTEGLSRFIRRKYWGLGKWWMLERIVRHDSPMKSHDGNN